MSHNVPSKLQSLLMIIFLIVGLKANAAMKVGIQAEFVRNNSEVEVTEVASNVLRIHNYTNKMTRFSLAWSIPSGWSMLGSKDRLIEVGANDSIFVPIRIIPEKIAKGGTSYITTVMLVSEQGTQFAAQNWYIKIREHVQWKGQLPVKQLFFTNDNDSAHFFVNLRNDGNTDETIRLSLVPDQRLTLYVPGEEKPSKGIFQIELPVGFDTTISFIALRHSMANFRRQKDADLRKQPLKESYTILVNAKGLSNQNWSSSVQLFKAGDHAQKNPFSHASLPLTLEVNVFDMLSQGTSMAVNAFGNAQLGENKFLNYRFQTVFVTSFLNQNSLLGLNHYIGYFDNKNSLEVGEVNGWGRSMLTGRGIKASHTFGNNTFGLIFTGTPGILDHSRTSGYGFYHSLRLKNLIWNNNVSRHTNSNLDLSGDIYNSSVTYKLNRFHQLVLGGGYSSDIAGSNQKILGYGYDISYSGIIKKFSIGAGTNIGSKYYAISRGINLYNGRITYAKGSKNTFTLSAQQMTQDPGYFMNNTLVDGNFIRSSRYELRWGINTPTAGSAFRPIYVLEKNNTISVVNRGIAFDYNPRNIIATRLSLTAYAGYTKIINSSLPDFFTSRLTLSSKWNQTFVSIRYQYGANSLMEQQRFVDDKINPQTLNIMASEDYWFGNGKFLLTTTGSLNYQTYWERTSFRLRPELFYYSKSGVRFSFYASFITTTQKANPMAMDIPNRTPFVPSSNEDLNFGFGIRKTIGVPVPGKKFGSARIVVFKDVNGNGKQDKDEDGIPNVLINIKAIRLFNQTDDSTQVLFGEDLVTNDKGEVNYENIPAGVYSIRPTSLTGQSEWMEAGAQEITIDKKQTVNIPLSRGLKLTGVLLVAREKYSDETPVDVGRIRVTAIDSAGKSISVLTDRKGEFNMFLPAGVFTVTINEEALGDKFILQQNRIVLDLRKVSGTYRISFNAIEKRRKMDIKKF